MHGWFSTLFRFRVRHRYFRRNGRPTPTYDIVDTNTIEILEDGNMNVDANIVFVSRWNG